MDAVALLKEFHANFFKDATSSSDSCSLSGESDMEDDLSMPIDENDPFGDDEEPSSDNKAIANTNEVFSAYRDELNVNIIAECDTEDYLSMSIDENYPFGYDKEPSSDNKAIANTNEALLAYSDDLNVYPIPQKYISIRSSESDCDADERLIGWQDLQSVCFGNRIVSIEEYPTSPWDFPSNNETVNSCVDQGVDPASEIQLSSTSHSSTRSVSSVIKNKMANSEKKITIRQSLDEREKEDDEQSMVSIIEYQDFMDIEEPANEQDNNASDIAVLKFLLTQKQESTTTKTGELRKRRKFVYSKEERSAMKKQIAKLMHPVKETCSHSQCVSSMSGIRRESINSQFWTFDYDSQCVFGYGTISRQDCKHKTQEEVTRVNTFSYYLHNDAGTLVNVCKIFYLTTLGYGKSNDSFIRMIVGRENYLKPLPRIKMQGHHLKRQPIDRTVMVEHIMSFRPTISHYRREHAPKRLYLPSDITISRMYKNFQEKYPKMCSYDLYRKIVSDDLNISFAHLGNEECEKCEEFKLHNSSHPKDNVVLNCSVCREFKVHHKLYIESRQLYFSHKNISTRDHIYASKDLQKIMMLPRMDMFKEVMFCPRLSLLNECFVPIGKKRKGNYKPTPMAAIWHEAIAGRNKEEFISCFYKFFVFNRDCKHFTIWLDNCGSQNKNWALYTFLIYIINSELINAETIELYYFQPGHTFMSADSFHHRIELALKHKKKVYDFNDFKEAVIEAGNGNVNIAEMNLSDFYDWPDCSSKTKRTEDVYMKDIVCVRAERGKSTLIYKTSYSSPEEFELNFLQLKYVKAGIPTPEPRSNYRGITKERKDNIIQKLGSLMEENRLAFWYNVPETNQESALYDCEDN